MRLIVRYLHAHESTVQRPAAYFKNWTTGVPPMQNQPLSVPNRCQLSRRPIESRDGQESDGKWPFTHSSEA